jgi:hypothetical protein
MLLIDPDNLDAQRLRSLIQSEMHRDLDNARTFLRTAHSGEKSEKESQPNLAAVPAALGRDADPERAKPSLSMPPPMFSADTSSRRMPRKWWLAAAGILIVAALIGVALPRLRTDSKPVQSTLPASTPPPVLNHAAVKADVVRPSREVTKVPKVPEVPQGKVALPSSPAVAASGGTVAASRPVVAAASGTLAISSTTSVDIYENGTNLGSVPVSLTLPAGVHTLEYRHGNLRKNLTHVISSNQTTKAMITFDVSVQINSKPWAEVFIDGEDRRALGQTPLSGVKVQIGSILIFENPQFQPKKYRVTGNETGIQRVFP